MAGKRQETGIRQRPNGRWRATVELPRHPDGTRRGTRSEHFDTRDEASRWRTDTLYALGRGDHGRVIGGRPTVYQFAERWAGAANHSPGTAKITARMLRRLWDSPLAGAQLGDVTRLDGQEWVNALRAEGLAPGTVRCGYLAKLNAIFNAAVDEGLVAANPLRKIHIPGETKGRPLTVLTAAQVRALADEMPHWQRSIVIVQAGSGLRSGELCALRRQDVDLAAGTISVKYQLQNGQRIAPKSNPRSPRNRSVRVVRVMPHVLKELARHMLRYPQLDDGTIFVNRFGNRHSNYRGSLRHAAARCAAADPTWPEAGPTSQLRDTGGVTSHKLRHFYATSMLAAGFTVHEVAEWLGDRVEMVIQVYGHAPTDTGDRVHRMLAAASAEWLAPPADDPGEDSGRTDPGLASV